MKTSFDLEGGQTNYQPLKTNFRWEITNFLLTFGFHIVCCNVVVDDVFSYPPDNSQFQKKWIESLPPSNCCHTFLTMCIFLKSFHLILCKHWKCIFINSSAKFVKRNLSFAGSSSSTLNCFYFEISLWNTSSLIPTMKLWFGRSRRKKVLTGLL